MNCKKMHGFDVQDCIEKGMAMKVGDFCLAFGVYIQSLPGKPTRAVIVMVRCELHGSIYEPVPLAEFPQKVVEQALETFDWYRPTLPESDAEHRRLLGLPLEVQGGHPELAHYVSKTFA